VSSSDKVLGAGSVSTKVPSLLLSGSDRRATIPEKRNVFVVFTENMNIIILIIIINK
jgi:hypothetical protein